MKMSGLSFRAVLNAQTWPVRPSRQDGRTRFVEDRRHPLVTNETHRRAPRAQAPRRRRDDFRALLRSRVVQGVLAVTVLAQGTVVMARHQQGTAAHEAAVEQAYAALSAQPLRTAPAATAAAVASAEKVAASAGASAVDEAVAALAAKYRGKGYRVPDALAEDIHEAAVENDIDPEIAFGLVRTESGFKNSATSPVGAVGLTQLMPATARWMEPGVTRRDLRDQETNLRIGFRYLRELIEKYDGNTRLALLAYNRGPGTVDRVLKRGGNPDNGYARKVMGK
jgi:soluble lytic murein transglycosylase-like protein